MQLAVEEKQPAGMLLQGIKANMRLLLTTVMRKEALDGRFQRLYPKVFYAAAFLHSVLVMHSQLETSVYQFRLSDFRVSSLHSLKTT